MPARTTLEPCPDCDRRLSPSATSCPGCGWQPRSGGVGAETIAAASVAAGVAGFAGAPVLGPVAAIMLGQEAQERMGDDPHAPGAEMARAGITLGWARLALGVAAAVIGLLFFLSVAARMGESFNAPGPDFGGDPYLEHPVDVVR